MNYYSQWDLANFLKKKRKFMTAKQISKETKTTMQTVNRKLNKLKSVEKKKIKIKVGKCVCKRPVTFFRFKVK